MFKIMKKTTTTSSYDTKWISKRFRKSDRNNKKSKEVEHP